MYSSRTLSSETMARLRALIRLHLCIAEAFRRAADQLDDPARAERMLIRAAARESFAEELESLITKGRPLPESGPLGDALRRWWTRLLDMAEAGRQYLVHQEVARGADQIRSHLDEIMQESLDEPPGASLLVQLRRLSKLRNRIGRSTDAWAPSAEVWA